MRANCFSVAFVLALSLSLAIAHARESVPIMATYEGKVANDKKPELKTGFIASDEQWKKVWMKLNPEEKVPEIDFAEHLLLISSHDAADPNRRSASVNKDDAGVVSVLEISTRIGFEPSDHTVVRFYKVARDGITGVRQFDPEQGKEVVNELPK